MILFSSGSDPSDSTRCQNIFLVSFLSVFAPGIFLSKRSIEGKASLQFQSLNDLSLFCLCLKPNQTVPHVGSSAVVSIHSTEGALAPGFRRTTGPAEVLPRRRLNGEKSTVEATAFAFWLSVNNL